jgi:Protein kinase domain
VSAELETRRHSLQVAASTAAWPRGWSAGGASIRPAAAVSDFRSPRPPWSRPIPCSTRWRAPAFWYPKAARRARESNPRSIPASRSPASPCMAACRSSRTPSSTRCAAPARRGPGRRSRSCAPASPARRARSPPGCGGKPLCSVASRPAPSGKRGTLRSPPLAPRALASGEWEGRAYLVVEWCGCVDAVTAAGELRRSGGAAARGRLLALCRSIADAYRRLHEQGVVHGDVHPRNVLVGAGGEVRLIDFGLARCEGPAGELAPVGRGGVGFFFEPELAAAALAGRPAPAATTAGEQHAVAALLYLLLCGAHYLDFSLEREEMLRQIAQHSPLAFTGRDLEPWPVLEAVLGRALAKDPADRFGSLGELCSALAAVAAAQREAPPADRPRRAGRRRSSRGWRLANARTPTSPWAARGCCSPRRCCSTRSASRPRRPLHPAIRLPSPVCSASRPPPMAALPARCRRRRPERNRRDPWVPTSRQPHPGSPQKRPPRHAGTVPRPDAPLARQARRLHWDAKLGMRVR